MQKSFLPRAAQGQVAGGPQYEKSVYAGKLEHHLCLPATGQSLVHQGVLILHGQSTPVLN